MCPAHDVGSDLLQLAGLDRPHEYVPLGRREPHQVAPSRRCGPRALPRASPGGATAVRFGAFRLASGERLLEASGLRDQANLLDEEDVQALKAVRIALEAGFPEKALVQLAHVYADALGRVAEAETRLFHFYVHERLKTQGLAGNELMA